MDADHAPAEANPNRHLKKDAFLAAYAECGSITRAAKAAQINRCTHFEWMKLDPDYAERFEHAHEEACDNLEIEARRRAVEGIRRLKFHKGDPIIDPETQQPYFEHEYSDTLLIFLMKGAMPEKYRERVDTKIDITSVDAAIERELARLAPPGEAQVPGDAPENADPGSPCEVGPLVPASAVPDPSEVPGP